MNLFVFCDVSDRADADISLVIYGLKKDLGILSFFDFSHIFLFFTQRNDYAN